MAAIESGNGSGAKANVDVTLNALQVLPKGIGVIDFNPASEFIDSGGRIRVSEPAVVFEYTFSNGLIPTVWDNGAFGAGTFTQNTTAFCTELNTTTAANTGYWIQSFSHVRYASGIGVLHHITFAGNVLQANQTLRAGIYSDQGTFPSAQGDGLYFEAAGTQLSVVRRSLYAGGSGAEERVTQANWNLDKLDGTGASGVTIDVTKATHVVINYLHLGVSGKYETAVGFITNMGLVWAHTFVNANTTSAMWSRTGSLPVRAEIFTTGTVAQAGKLTLFNTAVIHEGVVANRGWRYFGATSGATSRTIGLVAGLYPLIGLRGLTTNDITKRTTIIPTKASILVTTAATSSVAMQWALLALPTPMTGATYAASAGASSFVGVDQAATASTLVTGTVLASGVLPVAAGLYQIDFLEQLDNIQKAGQNAAGSLTITGANSIVLAYGPLVTASGANAVVSASINWKELS